MDLLIDEKVDVRRLACSVIFFGTKDLLLNLVFFVLLGNSLNLGLLAYFKSNLKG